VAPACHYASGGVETDLDGASSVPGLYACGEVACSGVHGANRLASNSLLEGLVFGRRIADRIAADLPALRAPAADDRVEGLVDESVRPLLQSAMTEFAGVLRSDSGLTQGEARLAELADKPSTGPNTAAWETTNLLTVAAGILAAADARTETRGSHWREDYPDRDDAAWDGHLLVMLRDGAAAVDFEPRGHR
jgi:L-aspartate oxidase